MSQYYAGYYFESNHVPEGKHVSNNPIFDNPDFLLGVYDRYGNINLNFECCIDCENVKLINEIIKYIKIPFDFSSNCLVFKNSNCIDFIGKLYNDSKEKLFDRNKMKQFYNIVQNDIPTIEFSLIHEMARPPNKVRMSDAGYDISIIKFHKSINSTTNMYSTGIKLSIPNGYYIKLVPRSSLPKYGYMLSNSIGIIDQGYTGEILVQLTQICDDPKKIEFPFKCCQLILEKQYYAQFKEKNTILDNTARNTEGFGSTGC